MALPQGHAPFLLDRLPDLIQRIGNAACAIHAGCSPPP